MMYEIALGVALGVPIGALLTVGIAAYVLKWFNDKVLEELPGEKWH